MKRAKKEKPRPQTWQQRYERGDKTAIMDALQWVVLYKKRTPEWLWAALFHAFARRMLYEIESWDEVFGPPFPKGKSRKVAWRNRTLTVPIYRRVKQLSAAGQPIDKGLFEQVGEYFGTSGTTASDIYYGYRARVERGK